MALLRRPKRLRKEMTVSEYFQDLYRIDMAKSTTELHFSSRIPLSTANRTKVPLQDNPKFIMECLGIPVDHQLRATIRQFGFYNQEAAQSSHVKNCWSLKAGSREIESS